MAEDDKRGNSRRDLLRSLSGARFFESIKETITTSGNRPDPNPASEQAVIPGGREQQILALIGDLQHEPPAHGFRFEKALVSADRIAYVFRGDDGTAAVINLVSLSNVAAGIVHAYSRSFRILVSGDAPEEVRYVVGDRAAAEIQHHDLGHLWVAAAQAPPREET